MLEKTEDRDTVQSKSKAKSLSKFVVLIVIVYLATYASLYGLRFVLATEYPIVVVEGVSMQPTYYEGDLLVLRGVPKSEIAVGNVVVYRRVSGGILIVHRVVNILVTNGELFFITQGDNRVTNPTPDRPVPGEDVIGVVSFHVAKLGGFVLALQSPFGLVFSGALIVVVLLVDVFSEQKTKPEKTPSL